jgi:NADH dehydrogenase [ubiquinone] 1 alpha subcomplex assembly factor 7
VRKRKIIDTGHTVMQRLCIFNSQRTGKGWREVLVDIDPNKALPEKGLRFVLAPGQTPASAAYTSLLPQATQQDNRGSDDGDKWCEICPEGLVLAKELASRVRSDGGAALIADYGEEKITKNTLRVSYGSSCSYIAACYELVLPYIDKY